MKRYCFIQILILITLTRLNSSKFLEGSSHISADLKYVRSCLENNANTLQLYLSHRKFNRTHVGVDMNITLPELFDHTYELEVEFRIWGDGGWKKNWIHIRRKNACSTLYLIIGPVWTSIIDAAHVKQGCPVQPGYYFFHDLSLNIKSMPVVIQSGRFFIYARTIKNSITTACLEGEFEVKAEIN